MALTDVFSRMLTMRRFLRAIDRIALAQEQQAQYLKRLADRVAPEPLPTPTVADLRETGPSYGRDSEFVKIQEFEERCWRDLKRAPSEEEVMDFLEGREVRI